MQAPWLVISLVVTAVALAPSDASAGDRRLPCVGFTDSLGQYGAFVFHLRHRPRSCTEYRQQLPDHAHELRMVGLRWRGWGGRRATGFGRLSYCQSGACARNPLQVFAYRVRSHCGVKVYTRLRVKFIDGSYTDKFRLPSCGGPFQYI